MLCPRCNVANGEGEVECRNCGQRLTCVWCGERMGENDLGWAGCRACQEKVYPFGMSITSLGGRPAMSRKEKWEPIPKMKTCQPFTFEPRLRACRANSSQTSVRLVANNSALAVLPKTIVFLRNGDNLAVREGCGGDLPYTIRKVTAGRFISATGIATIGQVFRLVPDGDMFLLEPVVEVV